MRDQQWSIIFLTIIASATAEIKNKGWWKTTVFYQIYPRSFIDSDNDGIGDLKGITHKLEHFTESGIGAIWLSPIFTSPMEDFGYDISDFYGVDDIFGSLNDLKVLMSKAKELGIKVILDFVPNHTSDKHYWFTQSLKGAEKYKDYYVWQKGRNNNTEPPNNWRSAFSGSAWTYYSGRDMWYLHQFGIGQPDLNFENPEVRREMEEIIKFWLEKGIDGLRIDSAPYFYERVGFPDEPLSYLPGVKETDYEYLRHIYTKDDARNYDLIRDWRKIVDEWSDSHNEDEKVILTEAYTNLRNTTKMYNYGSNIPFNFYFITSTNKSSKPSDFKNIILNWLLSMPSIETPNWVLGNHDNARVTTRYPGRADQMTMLTMILPGVAVTYNGEEIAMEDYLDISWEETVDPQACNTNPQRYKLFTRDPERTPFQWDNTQNAGFSKAAKTWLPVNPNYKTLNLEQQKRDPESHYKLYQTLTQLRKDSETLKSGDLIVEVANDEKVLVVSRQNNNGDAITLLINFSDNEPQRLNVSVYTPNALKASVIVSSVGSGIKWRSLVDLSAVILPPKASVLLHSKE